MKMLIPFALILVTTAVVYPQPKSSPKGKTTNNSRPKAVTSAVAVPGPVKCTAAGGFKQEEIAELLSAHNKLREAVKTAPLVWDCKLAAYAQEWASRNVSEHRETDYGENIFVSSNAGEPIKAVIDRWVLEKEYWDNAKGACKTGKTCTHYTQTVWKATTKLGCGINRTGTGKWKTIVVCNYDPVGNWPGPAY